MIEWKKEIIAFKFRIINARPLEKVKDGNIYQKVAVIHFSKRKLHLCSLGSNGVGRERRRGAFYI